MFPDFRKSIAFWKVPRLRPFVLLVPATWSVEHWWNDTGSGSRSTRVEGGEQG